MLSNNDIAIWINEKVSPIIPGLKGYGIGRSALRGDHIEPYVDGAFIGIDDTYTAMIYHKEVSVASTPVQGSGFGDNDGYLQTTFQMAALVFFNEKKCGHTPAKLYTFIQAAITGILKVKDYRSARVNVTSAILNDAQVWQQEYGNTPYKLDETRRLMQINYSIVLVVDKNCIAIPNCKN